MDLIRYNCTGTGTNLIFQLCTLTNGNFLRVHFTLPPKFEHLPRMLANQMRAVPAIANYELTRTVPANYVHARWDTLSSAILIMFY